MPQSFLSGSLEERAERIRQNETIKPTLLKVLALDLAAAAAIQGKWLEPVEALLVRALGLRAGHKAGDWYRWHLERRGRRKLEDFDAWSTAALIDRFCYRQYGKVKSQHALAKELQRRGFKTHQRRIGEWRKDSYGARGTPMYVPPDAPTMTPQEDREVPRFVGGPGIRWGILPPEE